ncbi:MAG TPA: class I SAM-dependent methyltransferase [Alphaproteobacteria bacterium]|nr:class I SAM-dependent methyltransferase [Alphaproteobacteria bacterium]
MIMPLAKRLRLARMGLMTLFGPRPQGFFIPYRYADRMPRAVPPYAAFEALFERHRPAFQGVLDRMDAHADALLAIGAAPPPAPRWAQSWFPRLDAAAAYVILRDRRPKRVVEVGSGHSTRFLARAAADGGLDVDITAIDPAPRADIGRLPVALVRSPVQEAEPAPFAALAPGDVLFIDSSHIAMPGSDVDLLFGRVLPSLPAGVLVHIHDICLPDDYFPAWQWRGYNEQALASALLAGGGYQPLFASRYVATRMADAVARSVAGRLALPEGAVETSLWLRKTAQPIGPLA